MTLGRGPLMTFRRSLPIILAVAVCCGSICGGDPPTSQPAASRVRFVYVLDAAGNNIDHFDLMKKLCLSSIANMTGGQLFQVVVLTHSGPVLLGDGSMLAATDQNKLAAAAFLKKQKAFGKIDHAKGLLKMFSLLGKTPSLTIMHLLSNGLFADNGKLLKTIEEQNRRKRIAIHTTQFGNSVVGATVLRKIAKQNGGKYTRVQMEDE